MALNGLSSTTFANLQVEAGAAFKNLGITKTMTPTQFKDILSSAKSSVSQRIGATDGGFNFKATAETHQPSVDGLRAAVKGLVIVDSLNVSLSFTSREITPENWALAIGNASVESGGGGHKIITPRFKFDSASYTDEITFVGEMNDGNTIVAVSLLNVLNIPGVNFQSNNKGEGGFSFELQAHLPDPWNDTPPYLIHYFEGTA